MSRGSSHKNVEGRGGLMKLLNASTKSPISNESSAEYSKSTSTSSGRGKLFELLTSGISSVGSSSGSTGMMGRGKLFFECSNPITKVEFNDTVEEKFDKLTIQPAEKAPILKHGTKGRSINVLTNYIRLKTDPNKGVFQYLVIFSPAVDSRDFRFKYLNQHKDFLGTTRLFDGNELCLPFQLPESITILKCKHIVDESDVTVKIMFKRKKYFSECIQLYNNLFDKILKILKFVRFGRKLFDPSAPIIIPQHKLEIWPGFVTAVDDYEDGIMLCLDVNHRVLSQMSVLQHLTDIYQRDRNLFEENCLKSLLGSVVITRYNNKLYRIDNIDFTMSPLSTFESHNGEKTTFFEYYKKQYNINIRDTKQPLLISRKERFINNSDVKKEIIICLVPEICFLAGLTDSMISNTRLMRDIATHTRITPNQRIHSLKIFCENVKKSEEALNILAAWGLSLENGPLEIKARQLDKQFVKFSENQFQINTNADFSQYLNKGVLEAIDITDWILIHTSNDMSYARTFLECIEQNSRPLGLSVAKPTIIILNDDRTVTFVGALRKNIRASTQIVVIICPTIRQDRYSAIKKICCAEIPVPSQVIIAKTLRNDAKNRSIVQKIALQMNCKLGGTLWGINIPFKKVMIIGIDSYHDPKQKNNSVAAFVASLNDSFTRWYSRATMQSKKEEFVNGLCISMTYGLEMYKKRNGYLPDRIIIFRDGVSDTQLNICDEYEIPQMKDSCSKIDTNYNPTFTFIVVQKRINTKFYAINAFNETSNPDPGCVVDSLITRKCLYDYFIVSQNVRQGTANPAHYIVVNDTANFSPDILQQLSYKMCFLYYNWPGSVRVPACCQYAHKLAYLVGQSVNRQTSEKLADKLFYL